MRTQFPPRGPRSNHIKINVTTAERKEWELVAVHYGLTVVEAAKAAMKHELQRLRDAGGMDRGDPVPAVKREVGR